MTIFGKSTERRFPAPTTSCSPGPAYKLPSTLSPRGPKVKREILDDGERFDALKNGNVVYKSGRESWIAGEKSNSGLMYQGKKDFVSPGPIYRPSVKLVRPRTPVPTSVAEKRFQRAEARYMGKSYEHMTKPHDAPGPGAHHIYDPATPRVTGAPFGASSDNYSPRKPYPGEPLQFTPDERTAWIRGVALETGGFALKDMPEVVGPALLSTKHMQRAMKQTKPLSPRLVIPQVEANRESNRFGSPKQYVSSLLEVDYKGRDSPGPKYNPVPPQLQGGTVSQTRDSRIVTEHLIRDIREFKAAQAEETLDKNERYYKFVNCPESPGPGRYEISRSITKKSHHQADFKPPPTEYHGGKIPNLSRPKGFAQQTTPANRTYKLHEPKRPASAGPFGRGRYERPLVAYTDQLGPNISPRAYPATPNASMRTKMAIRRENTSPAFTVTFQPRIQLKKMLQT